jgi:hypothetical protein
VKVSPTIENDESVLAEVQQSIECVPVIKDLLFKKPFDDKHQNG